MVVQALAQGEMATLLCMSNRKWLELVGHWLNEVRREYGSKEWAQVDLISMNRIDELGASSGGSDYDTKDGDLVGKIMSHHVIIGDILSLEDECSEDLDKLCEM